MKLLEKLSIILMLTALVFGVAIGTLIYFFTEKVLEDAIAEQQFELAKQTLDKVDRHLYERLNDVVSIANEEVVENFLLGQGDNAVLSQRMQELLTTTGPWDNLNIVDTKGDIIFSSNASGHDNEHNNDNGYEHEHEHEHHQDYYEKALAGEVTYSDVVLDPTTGLPTMMFAIPVQSDTNPEQILGVVIAHLSWSPVLEVLQSSKSNTIELFNRYGYELGDNFQQNFDEILTENFSHTEPLQRVMQGLEGSEVLLAVDGDEQTLTSYVREKGFKNFMGNDWILLIETPTAIAFGEAKDSTMTLLVTFMLFVLLAVVVFTGFFYRIILKPIQSLTAVTEEIARGDLSKRAFIHSSDEIGQLAVSFNIMAHELQNLYTGLEKKVKQKTGQLAQKIKEIQSEKLKDEAILASIGDAIIVVDQEGRVLIFNPLALQLLHLEQKELKGKILREVFDLYKNGKPISFEERPDYITLQTGRKVSEVSEYHRKDDKKILLEVIANPVIEAGKTIGAIMLYRDVTKEKEIDRMKTEFISLASHQLRTPLSAIKWFTEMLLAGDAGPLNNEQKDFTQNISDSTQRMIQLVNSLLNISRIESGRIIVDPHPTDLKDLIEGVISDLKVKLEEKKHNIVVSVHDDLPKINIDARLIRQVYMNLLTNAIKYTPKGGEISVLVSKKGKEVISQVADNGYGVPKDEQEKLFQKFFRADNVAKVETDGTGLGLYLIKAIINSSGGKIWFKSEEGKGSTFWFTLPLSGMKPQEGEVTLDN